jgi:endoglucanase
MSESNTLSSGRRVVGWLCMSSGVGVLAVACSAPGPGAALADSAESGSNPAGSAGATGQSVNGASGSGPSAAGPSVPGPVGAAPPAPPADVTLDDFSDGDGRLSTGGFAGVWRTYSDGTGTVTPNVDTEVVPTDGAIHVVGSGFATWGVGLTVDLNNASGAATGRQTASLDAFRGLSLRARGTGSLAIEIVTPATTGTAEAGGTCTAAEGCFGHYAGTLNLSAEYTEQVIEFASLRQPVWAASAPLDLSQVLAINFLSRRADGDAPVGIDLWVDSVALAAALPSAVPGGEGTAGGLPIVNDGTNPFSGRELHSDGGAAFGAYESAQGADRELLGKVALNPSAFWLAGGDPSRAGSIVAGAAGKYTVLVAYNIPDRDCSGESAGGAGSSAEYQGWIDAMSDSLQGQEAAIILEPDALALSCGESTESLISYAVASLRQNPGVAVYIDGGHSNWVSAGEMASRLRSAGIEQATGFAVNVSNFQPTSNLVDYGRSLSALVGGKPFVVDTSRNGRGALGGEWCNPAGRGLGEAPTTSTGDAAVHAFLWVKRPGESDGACGQCAGSPAGQFCTSYAIELAQNAVF